MLLEIAIGDAYGAGFEYVAAQRVRRHNDLTAYVQHPRHRLAPGSYTDDTQMTVAVVEAMLADEAWTADLLASSFVRVFQRDPRAGYSKRTYGALHGARDGADFLARLDPISDTSGAAMRAAPLGLYPDVAEVAGTLRFLQAALTHNTPDGIRAAQAASLLTHFTYYRLGPKSALLAFLSRHLPGDWSAPWRGKVGRWGLSSVAAALTALLRCARMSELLRTCVAFTGDVDTVAAIALAAGSCCVEIEQDLPAILDTELEPRHLWARFSAGVGRAAHGIGGSGWGWCVASREW